MKYSAHALRSTSRACELGAARCSGPSRWPRLRRAVEHGRQEAQELRPVLPTVGRRAGGQRDGVAVVSGGGSGHEPAMGGYVGDACLTAAVCGDVFASPTIKAVLAAILAVTGEGGCLLIVMNYTVSEHG